MEYYTIIIDWLSSLKPVELTILGGAMTALGSFFVFLWKKFTKPKKDIKAPEDNDIESRKTTTATLNTGVSVTGTVHGDVYFHSPINAGNSTNAPTENLLTLSKVYSDNLPVVTGEFFGRIKELAILQDAWINKVSPIVEFVAPGGTGKTKLLRHWIDNLENRPNLIAWSFYNQGSTQGNQASTSTFFENAFFTLGEKKNIFNTDEEKGQHLANLLKKERFILILDGLEPMQYLEKGMSGAIKDKALTSLLRNLAGQQNCFCIITTRISVYDLSGRSNVISHDLQNLDPFDGVSLLKSLGVRSGIAYQADEDQLLSAVLEYDCHALAIHLLGNAVHTHLEGNILLRYKISELKLGEYSDNQGRHAFKVLNSYDNWFRSNDGSFTPELSLLYLLGLFDHPIDSDVLELLWKSDHSVITDKFDMRDWKRAHRDLRDKHHLLSTHVDNPNLLDCHPLIRVFFAKKLQQSQPQIWQYANEVLYKYYAELPRKRLQRDPENLLEMQPLFSAIEHGCKAGLHVEVFQSLYWPRVRKGTDNYLCKVLGAHADDLSCLSHFFTSPWQTVSANMPVSGQISLLSMTAFRLRALGRLQESLEPSLRSIALSKQAQDWVGFVNSTNNLSETQLLLGQVQLAIQTAKESVQVCDELSKDGTYDLDFERMSNRTTLADAFHQGGEYVAATFLFEEAEKIKENYAPEYPLLTSIEGYRFCNFLLDDSNDSEATTKVLFRSNEWLKWRVDSDSSLDVGFENLATGKLKQKLGALNDSIVYFNTAFNKLSSAGVRHHLPRVLLARASTYRLLGNVKLAYEDLEEINDIAGRSDLRLHLVDYHLESARLALLVNDSTKLLHHQNEASKLIEETGYVRRKLEIYELENLCP